jgi:hypothetical protein
VRWSQESGASRQTGVAHGTILDLVAFIRRVQSKTQVCLDAEHLVGRAPDCLLQLPDGHVSSRHAMFRWHEGYWWIRDLASLNGTFVDGRRLASGTPEPLARGTRLGFGTDVDEWELVDERGPCIMALPEQAGEPLYADQYEMIGIPSPAEPLLTIYRAPDGLWRLERADQSARVLVHGDKFDVAGQPWHFVCPAQVAPSITEEQAVPIESVTLVFGVSADEEHVHLRARVGARDIDLGARNHNYLLLQLARVRLADRADGQPPTVAGWYYQDELTKKLRVEPMQLNLDIFRIRRHIAAKGIPNAVQLIERRATTRQLRIGTDLLQIVNV